MEEGLCHSHMQGSLSDDEIIDFFRYGERKQIRLTRKITVLCGLLKSNKDIILSNTFNPFGDGIRFRCVEDILAKTERDTRERIQELEAEYQKIQEEINRLDRIRQSVFRLETEDYELLSYLYQEGNTWRMAEDRFHVSRSLVSNRRRRALEKVKTYFEEAGERAGTEKAQSACGGTEE